MIDFNNTYIDLPERFYEEVKPVKVSRPSLIQFNFELAKELKITSIDSNELAEIFSGNKILAGSQPLAQAYAGHQFGQFVPQLGDGRAILLGEVIDSHGKRKDIQLKGSGPTVFSRSGDGRAWLGPVIREYIVSEAMHALQVPTTRALAAVLSGEDIYRETALPGAILTRVASSHIRIGSFEYFAAQGDTEALKTLANYVIDRHYPELKEVENKYSSLVHEVAGKQAKLISKWLCLGFIHGVMNTDNMSISGETIDFGPCAFMDFYHPNTVFSSIDRYGRYAYQNQASIAHWNLSSFANTLLDLIDPDQQKAIEICKELLDDFKINFANTFRLDLLKKIGIPEAVDSDSQLIEELLELMREFRADFTLSFRYLADLVDASSDPSKFLKLFDNEYLSASKLKQWLEKWRLRIKVLNLDAKEISQNMKAVNPAFIPRNHRVEAAIKAAHRDSDFSEFEKLLTILAKPYTDQPEYKDYMLPPANKDGDYVTFCGT